MKAGENNRKCIFGKQFMKPVIPNYRRANDSISLCCVHKDHLGLSTLLLNRRCCPRSCQTRGLSHPARPALLSLVAWGQGVEWQQPQGFLCVNYQLSSFLSGCGCSSLNNGPRVQQVWTMSSLHSAGVRGRNLTVNIALGSHLSQNFIFLS